MATGLESRCRYRFVSAKCLPLFKSSRNQQPLCKVAEYQMSNISINRNCAEADSVALNDAKIKTTAALTQYYARTYQVANKPAGLARTVQLLLVTTLSISELFDQRFWAFFTERKNLREWRRFASCLTGSAVVEHGRNHNCNLP